jgi:hypothetical protein
MAIWNILSSIGIFSPYFGILYQEKSGNPALIITEQVFRNFINFNLRHSFYTTMLLRMYRQAVCLNLFTALPNALVSQTFRMFAKDYVLTLLIKVKMQNMRACI